MVHVFVKEIENLMMEVLHAKPVHINAMLVVVRLVTVLNALILIVQHQILPIVHVVKDGLN